MVFIPGETLWSSNTQLTGYQFRALLAFPMKYFQKISSRQNFQCSSLCATSTHPQLHVIIRGPLSPSSWASSLDLMPICLAILQVSSTISPSRASGCFSVASQMTEIFHLLFHDLSAPNLPKSPPRYQRYSLKIKTRTHHLPAPSPH